MSGFLKANANNGRGELPIPLLSFFIFKILLFDFPESVVVGHQERLESVECNFGAIKMKRSVFTLIDEFLKEIHQIYIDVSAEFISFTIFEKTLFHLKSCFLGKRKGVLVLQPLILILRVGVKIEIEGLFLADMFYFVLGFSSHSTVGIIDPIAVSIKFGSLC